MVYYELKCPICGRAFGVERTKIEQAPPSLKIQVHCLCDAYLSFDRNAIMKYQPTVEIADKDIEGQTVNTAEVKSPRVHKADFNRKVPSGLKVAEPCKTADFSGIRDTFSTLAKTGKTIENQQESLAQDLRKMLPEFEKELNRNRVSKLDALTVLCALNRVYPEARTILNLLQSSESSKELFDAVDLMAKISAYVENN